MVLTQPWLIDTSAFARLSTSPDAVVWMERIDRGLVRAATVTLLELGYSARSGADWTNGFQQPPLSHVPVENLTPAMEARALVVQGLLAERGHHRAAKVPDLIVAATAETAGLTVLHCDKDFDLIADVTGQPVERLRVSA
ncbi:PIN domain nuclease [Ornithinimicrobium faecis]|nr:PIN domain nuclease [Ornithinimicrobium sp. HY1793]